MFIKDYIYGLTGRTENQVVELVNHLDPERVELYLLFLNETPFLSKNAKSLNCRVKILTNGCPGIIPKPSGLPRLHPITVEYPIKPNL